MATLILTAVGTAVGGPLGGAVGALIGQQADGALFAPRPRQGPRLGELAVQTSSYGTAIPKIFGTMRVAGTVIWATDLREEKTTAGGGKGQPKTVNYSYSASFAVALSGRAVREVRRIWADGKLLRGAAGDFKSRTLYRLYHGDEGQAPDPLIASLEGVGATPAFRGIAYAVFEDFALADYGNRIPSLSFEVVADDGPTSLGAVAEELSGGEIVGGETPALLGYAASGDSVRGAIHELAEATALSLVERDDGLILTTPTGEPVPITDADSGASSANIGGRTEIDRRAMAAAADEVSIAYYDIARDYQTGLQRASWNGPGRRVDRLAVPAVLASDAAKSIAQHRLGSAWAARTTASIHLPPRLVGVRPGERVELEGHSGVWKVVRWTLGRSGTVSLYLQRLPGNFPASAPADPGRAIGHVDQLHGPTVIRLFDLPLYDDGTSDRPQLFAIAAGTEPGWRRADLMISYDRGTSWTSAGTAANAAVIGTAPAAIGPAPSSLIDRRNSVEVQLLHEGMWLEACDDAALLAGANLALLGEELVQFGSVEPLGEGRFRLSRLLRGRRGTEWAMHTHQAGEAFVLIERGSLTVIAPSSALIGGEARILASGLGDENAVEATCPISGEAVRPPLPAHLRAERREDGSIAVGWVRRSRRGWDWISGSDAPLAEESERYQVRLAGSSFERVVEVQQSAFVYTAADQVADGLAGALTIEIRQMGTLAVSRPATLTFP